VAGRAPDANLPLYRPLEARQFVSGEIAPIPYYTFQNREGTPMEVWIPWRAARRSSLCEKLPESSA